MRISLVLLLALSTAARAAGLDAARLAEAAAALDQGYTTVDAEALVPAVGLRPGNQLDLFSSERSRRGVELGYGRLLESTSRFRAASPRGELPARGADGIDVGQKDAGVTRFAEGLPRYVQTHGAGPCVILTLYAPASRTAAIAHLDATTHAADSVIAMLRAMRLADGERVEGRLIGGYRGWSEGRFISAIAMGERLGVEFVEASVQDHDKPKPIKSLWIGGEELILNGVAVESIILDSADGQVYDLAGVIPEGFAAPPVDLNRTRAPVRILPRGLAR